MLQESLDDIKIYLRDEGLYEDQIQSFMDSHDLPSLDEDEAWEVVESHIFRDLDSVDMDGL